MGITQYIARQFGKPTGIGGIISTAIMNLLNRRMYKTCQQTIQKIAPKRVFDIGVGNGYSLSLLQKALKESAFSGIDISEDAVHMARKRLNVQTNLSVGDVCCLQFPDKSFDLVYTINTIYFWSDPMKGLQEIKRTLDQDGTFINICYTKQWLDRLRYTEFGFRKQSDDQWLDLHRQAGFSSVEKIDIDKGKSFYIICRR